MEVQLEAIGKINRWELSVEGEIYFWWDIDGIERLLEEENIPWDLYLNWTRIRSLWKLKRVWWNLDLRWTRIELQLEAWKKIKEWKLIVKWKFLCDYEEYFEELIGDDWEINFGNLESKYWNNVDDIGDEKIKGIIKKILIWWLWYKKRERAKEIAEIIGKEGLSKEDKIKAILKLDRKYQELKQKLEWYGISLDK